MLIGMSKRLQVILDDKEMRDIQRTAKRQKMTMAEWVRQALRTARREVRTRPSPERKINLDSRLKMSGMTDHMIVESRR